MRALALHLTDLCAYNIVHFLILELATILSVPWHCDILETKDYVLFNSEIFFPQSPSLFLSKEWMNNFWKGVSTEIHNSKLSEDYSSLLTPTSINTHMNITSKPWLGILTFIQFWEVYVL